MPRLQGQHPAIKAEILSRHFREWRKRAKAKIEKRDDSKTYIMTGKKILDSGTAPPEQAADKNFWGDILRSPKEPVVSSQKGFWDDILRDS